MAVDAELRRRDAGGTIVPWTLVDDPANGQTGLSDPVVDEGARDRLDAAIDQLETLVATAQTLVTSVGALLTDTELRATPLSVADITGLVPLQYDQMQLGYTGDDVTTVVYKKNTVTVATLTLGYSGGRLVSVARS